jgi:hypothetical protein
VGRPGALPAAAYLAWVQNAMVLVLLSCVGFVLLLTPTGRLPSPRWRWWARVAATAVALGVLALVTDPRPLYPEHPAVGNPLAVPALAALFLPCVLVTLLGLVVGAGSLLGRSRRAQSTERLQLRWLALAAAVSAATLLLALATLLLGGPATLFEAAFGVSVGVLPLATGAAILRYRLYDIDRIISRTLAYGLLTVVLGLGYAAVVLGLGQLLGRNSSLVVAGATLAVAASVQPARRRIQDAVDRRFNRRRYDAARTIAAFSVRLRQEVDLDTLGASCWPWSAGPCNRPARRCGCGRQATTGRRLPLTGNSPFVDPEPLVSRRRRGDPSRLLTATCHDQPHQATWFGRWGGSRAPSTPQRPARTGTARRPHPGRRLCPGGPAALVVPGRPPGVPAGPPAGHGRPVGLVAIAELPGQSRLLVPAHEGHEGGGHHRGVRHQDQPAQQQGLPSDGGQDGQVHRVAHVPVEAADDQLPGRGDRRRGAHPLGHEAAERVHQYAGPGHQQHHPSDPQR